MVTCGPPRCSPDEKPIVPAAACSGLAAAALASRAHQPGGDAGWPLIYPFYAAIMAEGKSCPSRKAGRAGLHGMFGRL
jgi:hypothetical protein